MAATSHIVNGPETFELEATSLRLQLVQGEASITARTEPGVSVEVAEIVGSPLEIATDGGRVSIGYPSIGWDGWLSRLAGSDRTDRAVLRIRVGPGVAVQAATVAATVSIEQVAADVEVATASAASRVASGRGSVKVRTGSGPVVLTDHVGPANVVTASGDVTLQGDPGHSSVTTVSGRIDVRTGTQAAVLTTSTVTGDTHVHLPAEATVEVETRTVTGKVSIDGEKQKAFGIAKVELGGWGARSVVIANSVSGAIEVRRQDPGEITDAEITDA